MKLTAKLLAAALLAHAAPVRAAQPEELITLQGMDRKITDTAVPDAQPAAFRLNRQPGGAPVSSYIRAVKRSGSRYTNIRWSVKDKNSYNWDSAAINPDAVEQVYWGENIGGVGHAFVAFKFKPGGFTGARYGAARYLVVSVEAVLQEDEDSIGFDNSHGIVWLLSTLENYAKIVAGDDTTFNLWPFSAKVGREDMVKMVKTALAQAVVDRSDQHFNLAFNNCTTNALSIINSGLNEDLQVFSHIPARASMMLAGKGLLGEGRQFSPENPGGGLVKPK